MNSSRVLVLIKNFKYILLLIACSSQLAYSQLYFFGRNKIQYDEFEWKILKTEHFNIYYYDEFQEMAEIGANYAEEAYEDLKLKFNHVVTSRIPLIFYNTHLHFQQTNTRPGFIPEGVGGFFEFMKGRVVIPYLGSLAEFRHVIRHEMVHVFMMSKIYHVLSNHRTTQNKYPPLWFIEGLAEFWSTTWNSQGEMVLRDIVLNNFFSGMRDINRFYGNFIMYKVGQHFLGFVAEEYGEENILLIMENLWRFGKFSEVLEFTLGETFEEIDDKYEYALMREYFPLMEDKTLHRIHGSNIKAEGFNFSPSYYMDESARAIYYIGNVDGYTSVYKVDLTEDFLADGSPELIVRGEREAIFESFHLMQPSLTTSGDGKIAFVTKSFNTDVLHLYSIDNDKKIKTIRFDDLITIEAPSFSSDGNLIVFSSIDIKGFKDIFVYNIDEDSLSRATNDYYSDNDPLFASDDSEIIFVSDRTGGMYAGTSNLFKYKRSTEEIEYLTYSDADISAPSISPESNTIHFLADHENTRNIWRLEYNNDEPVGMTKLTDFVTSVNEFEFLDEHKVVTSALEKLRFQFYRVDLTEFEDSTNEYFEFNFYLAESKWQITKLRIPPENESLKYKKEYALDYAVSQVVTDPVYGTRGGALFTLSDLMGDDRYVFLIYNTAEAQSDLLSSFNVAVSKVNTKYRTNFGYGIFHYSGRRYDIRESDEYFYERSFGGFVSLLYPFSVFQRIEANVSLANSDKAVIENILSRKALLLSNSISFVHDNSLWGPTGPLDGSRFRLLLGYTSDIKFSNVNYYSVIADYRKYFRLGYYSALAARLSLYYNEGNGARRYFAGGSWDLRGYDRFSIRGEKMWISSLELRFPLLNQLIFRFPFFGLGFSNLRGAVFFDAGSAWDENYKTTLGSVGFGFRINFLGAIVFRYDMGKLIKDDFTRLQDGLFYQFFFGFDF
jgi:hypothetical protein